MKMINNLRPTSWVHRDLYSQRRELTRHTSWVHRDPYSQRRELTRHTSWMHRDPYSQRRELTRHPSWEQVQHEMKQGHYNFCDWRRDRKARTSCFSCNAWVCKSAALWCAQTTRHLSTRAPSLHWPSSDSLGQWTSEDNERPLFNIFFIHSAAEPIVLQQNARIVSLFFVAIKILKFESICSLPLTVCCKFRTTN